MDDPQIQLRRQIDDALPAIATVICAIIADYVVPEPYDWTVESTVGISVGRRSIEIPPTVIERSSVSVKLIHRCPDGSAPWYNFVSETTIGRGARRWTVSGLRMQNIGWIGAGVTADRNNSVNLIDKQFSAIATDGSYMVYPETSTNIYFAGAVQQTVESAAFRSDLAADGRSIFMPPSEAGQTACIVFEAVPKTLQIVGNLPSGFRFVLTTAANSDQFWKLRPCVALAGNSGAVVLSG